MHLACHASTPLSSVPQAPSGFSGVGQTWMDLCKRKIPMTAAPCADGQQPRGDSERMPMLFVGSSTACIVVLDRSSHRLHTANLGDSGFLVVRGGEVVHRSDEQQHYFNTPFQLSIAPPEAEGVVLSDR